MAGGFAVWRAHAGTRYCSVGELLGVDDGWEIGMGISRAAGFPDDARFEMNSRFPKQTVVADVVYNREGMIVASRRVRDLLEATSLRGVEYLPVRIVSHKGRVASEEHCIVHPVGTVDAIDIPNSEIEWNPLDVEDISICRKLVLAPDRLGHAESLFRLAHLAGEVIIERSLADQITAAGFTGSLFVATDSYRG